MSDLVVRDHSQPCEHGDRNESGKIPRFLFGDEWLCDVCPGGREITLRETAAWLPTKQYEAFRVHNQMGEWVDDVTGTTVYVEEA